MPKSDDVMLGAWLPRHCLIRKHGKVQPDSLAFFGRAAFVPIERKTVPPAWKEVKEMNPGLGRVGGGELPKIACCKRLRKTRSQVDATAGYGDNLQDVLSSLAAAARIVWGSSA